MLEQLREEVLAANLEVVNRGLVLYTFGNASGIDRQSGLVVIKPSGVPYESMRPSDLVIVDLAGRAVEGALRPSSDLPTHLELYKAFPHIGGVVHTHSRMATAWAQARREIPCMGTTHADYFYGSVPLTEHLSTEAIDRGYEVETGHAIVRRFDGLDPAEVPGVLVVGHAPFCWGKTPMEAARHAVILEEIATIAFYATLLNGDAGCLPQPVQDKHYSRKHGANAYYGQPVESPTRCPSPDRASALTNTRPELSLCYNPDQSRNRFNSKQLKSSPKLAKPERSARFHNSHLKRS